MKRQNTDSSNAQKPLVIDLFCGAGGMSLGFQMAGYHVGLGMDNDLLACQTYAHNFGQEHTACADITTIADPIAFVRERGLTRVDVITGGPPCQGFSRVGRGKLRQVNNDPNYIHDPRNQLYQEFLRFVGMLRPLWFVLENVPDMKYYHDGTELLLDKIMREFQALGYTLDYQILLAADYGVPQIRQRLFIVGNRLNIPVTWPEPEYQPDEYVTVWDAIGDLPIVGIKHRQGEIPYVPRCELNEYQRLMREGSDSLLYSHQTRWHNTEDIQAFTLLPEGGRYVDLPDHLRRYDSKSHPEKRNEWFRDRYRKLIRGEPSWTVEAHIGKDTYRHIYPSREEESEPPRTISVREAARLQSFPDRFRFLGAFTRQFYHVGNAVPPLLIKAVARAILPGVWAAMAQATDTGTTTADGDSRELACLPEPVQVLQTYG
jgi:DNA (cytosine-5)-methyltransferase 1